MEISKKQLLLVLAVTVLCTASLTYAMRTMLVMQVHQESRPRVNLYLIFERADGTSYLDVGNIIVDKGELLTRNSFSRIVSINATKLAVGNITGLDQTDTVLTDVYADPTDGSYVEGTIVEWANAGDYAYNCTWKWTFEETVTLDAAAAYFGNTTFAYSMANFPTGQETFNNNENLTVRYVHTYNAN